MKLSPSFSLVLAISGLSLLTLQEGQARSFSASREGARGGSVNVEGGRYGRAAAGSVSATGPRGATYEASGARVGRYSAGTVSATGRYGGTYQASAAGFNGYRAGYVYTGGVYRPATVTVNSLYVAPVGVYSGWRVVAQPTYVSYPVYATYPVETSVQVELKARGYYRGAVDGEIGPKTSAAIVQYQTKNGLQPTGQIDKALLVSLGIMKA